MNQQMKINNVFQNNLNKIILNINQTNPIFKEFSKNVNKLTEQMNKLLINTQLNQNFNLIKDELENIILIRRNQD